MTLNFSSREGVDLVKQSKSILSGSMWLLLLLLACVFLMVGAVWARYQIKDSQIFSYALKDYDFVYLWHSYDEDTGSFRGEQSVWQTQDDRKTLDFCVSNGTPENYAQADQRFNIRLLVGVGVLGEAEEMDVLLNFPQTGESFQGCAKPIVEGTPVYSTFGEGWVITFCNGDGEEISWTLEGAELSYLEGQIAVSNVDLYGTTLMQLQVIGDTSA